MKNRFLVLSLILIGVWATGASSADKTKLPERYQKWLEEEVVYTITLVEREIFLRLQTDRERDLFIEAFWKHRDPTPHSPENEFKTEHYRRFNYANHFFGRETPKPGWKTDRGRMYILLGEPNDIQRFQGKSGVYNTEVWFYQGKTELGLPPGFNLLFFQEAGYGEYRLYSPVQNGPQALLSNFMGGGGDYARAYQVLRDIDPLLADISLSLIPGDDSAAMGRPSLSSDILIQKIGTIPERRVDQKYAQKFLLYKDIVEVEYTANYLDSDALVKVFKDPSGLYFVHYAIEPKRLSVSNYENKYYTTLKVNGSATTADGKMVYQFDRSVTLNLDEDRMKIASNEPFALHDLFPLVPGDYKLSILLKNEASKEFSSLEQTVRIPQNGTSLEMSVPILGYKFVQPEQAQRRLKAFQIGPYLVYCQPNRVFVQKDPLIVGFQLNNLTAELRQKGEVKFAFLKDGQLFREKTRKVAEYKDLPNAIEEFPLLDFLPAHYQIQVSFRADGTDLVSAGEEFDVTFAQFIPRPWISSWIRPESGSPLYSQIIGIQLANLGRFSEARVFLESAFKENPKSEETALGLAQVYQGLEEFDKIIPLLSPFFSQTGTPKYELCFNMGQAFQKTKEWEKAIETYDKAISHYGINTSLLNAIGECYAGQGKNSEALAAWEKSLKLSPDQPEIGKKVDALKSHK